MGESCVPAGAPTLKSVKCEADVF
ncbi:hypothetical protein A2U01_0052012, partial [Trifolium medium]|nr:hypothetical protein [Trifolium medium]